MIHCLSEEHVLLASTAELNPNQPFSSFFFFSVNIVETVQTNLISDSPKERKTHMNVNIDLSGNSTEQTL